MRLSILIATVGERDERFQKLINILAPQVRTRPIEVLAYWNNGERPIAEIRQALVDDARGDYICFVDDDDLVPDYYCERIMTAIEGQPDYIGWRMQLWYDGVKTKPTYHSIRYPSWSDDENGYYRHASHLNPIKRDIALQVPFTGYDGPEDVGWSERVFPLLTSEEYIEDVMYEYHFNSSDSIWRGGTKPTQSYARPPLHPPFRYHPDSKTEFVP